MSGLDNIALNDKLNCQDSRAIMVTVLCITMKSVYSCATHILFCPCILVSGLFKMMKSSNFSLNISPKSLITLSRLLHSYSCGCCLYFTMGLLSAQQPNLMPRQDHTLSQLNHIIALTSSWNLFYRSLERGLIVKALGGNPSNAFLFPP